MTLPVVTLPETPVATHVEACTQEFTQLLGSQTLPLSEGGTIVPTRHGMQRAPLLAAAAVNQGLCIVCTLLGRFSPTVAALPCAQLSRQEGIPACFPLHDRQISVNQLLAVLAASWQAESCHNTSCMADMCASPHPEVTQRLVC